MEDKKKVIFVSGANRGIGKEIVRQLAAGGNFGTVLIGSRKLENGEAVKKEYEKEAKEGVQLQPLQFDVSDDKSVAAAKEFIQKKYGKLDVLINNAGIFDKKNDINEDKRTLEVNFYGVKRLIDSWLPLIPENGRIIVLSSSLGKIGTSYSDDITKRLTSDKLDFEALDGLAKEFVAARVKDPKVAGYKNYLSCGPSYCFSKALVNGLIRILAKDERLTKKNISIVAVCPGWVRTDMGGKEASLSVDKGADTPVWLSTVDEKINGKFYNSRKEQEY